ncbi:MAG: metallophosphoesterase [Proteobacteria bacterium]|nr:metallophosphoesterase [Pseudomonadota bacterium]
MNRRDFLNLMAAGGGAVFASGLAGCAGMASSGKAAREDFYFVQMSDLHWGYKGPDNPDALITLGKAVDSVNALDMPPEFIIFTGDITHTTDDPAERRRRMREARGIIAGLKVRKLYFMPGEHDASLDRGAAFKEIFGATHYSFEYDGIHFVVVDNVSDPGGKIGDEQLSWLKDDLGKVSPALPIVVFTHRPLFDLVPKWDWATRDGAEAIKILLPYPNVTVFYGHIHQEHHHMTGHIAHHAAKSLIFPLPAPGSQEKRTPLPWDPAAPYRGLGFREVDATPSTASYGIHEFPVVRT